MKSDYMYSVGIVYNTFPWAEATASQKAKIETLAQAVLDAREAHPTSCLADLYDPDTMPGNLRKGHAALDAAVDRLYRLAPFASDRASLRPLRGIGEPARGQRCPPEQTHRSKSELVGLTSWAFRMTSAAL
ncbi:MAG: hypothetical protein H0W74_05940 [Sphingosinicella sp.]|nr:hypothetical protein [Sphingosinicella sp.]